MAEVPPENPIPGMDDSARIWESHPNERVGRRDPEKYKELRTRDTSPVRRPALWAGPSSFTFLTKMVSMGSRRWCRGEGPGGHQPG